MSSYDNDQRVDVVDQHFVIVTADDRYDVIAPTTSNQWFTAPSLDPRTGTVAGVRREEVAEWVRQRQVGPFPSRDEAIASLIGPPR